MYSQEIVLQEHLSSIMHNEILQPSSIRVLELISYKYDELLKKDKKLELLLEENLLYGENYNEFKTPSDTSFSFKFTVSPFYEFNIFKSFKIMVKNHAFQKSRLKIT